MYVYVHMNVNICRALKGATAPPELKFQVFISHLMWMLGTEFTSLGEYHTFDS